MANPLTDIFTGAPGHEAAANQRTAMGAIIPNLATGSGQAYDLAGNILKGGYNQAKGDLGLGYDAAGNAIRSGAQGALGYLDQGTQGALGQLGQARTDLTAGGGAFSSLSDLAARYRGGADLYADSLGIHGAEGNTRAQAAFDAGPAYAWQRDQGIEALTRAANARGGLGGNSDRDAIAYASNLAKTSYGDWQKQLAGYNPLELQATTGAAQGNQSNNLSLANLSMAGAGYLDSSGRNKAGVATGESNSLADLARAYYSGHAGLATGEAGALAGNTLGGMQNNQQLFLGALPGWNSTYERDAKASQDASGATWGAIGGAANMALKASGVGGFGAPTFGGFGGGGATPTGPTYASGPIGAFGGIPFPIIGG
jgi:hypothetical protein